MTINQDETPSAVSAEEVRQALRQLLASQTFRRSERMSQFLNHAVQASLTNETSRLKEVCIGIEVFGRPTDYNPKADPVVRNEARRLRRKLEEYYITEGTADTLRIMIPRGAYVAKFEPFGRAEAPIEFEEMPKQEPSTPADLAPLSTAPPPTAPKPRWRRTWFVAAALALFAVLLPAYINRPGDRFVGAHVTYLTSLPTREVHPSISPDGKRVLYSSDQNGNYNIYVATLDGQSIRLTQDAANDLHPAWSPNCQQFAFLRAAGAGFDVILRPFAGGVERKVARVEHLKFGAPPHDDVLLAQGWPGPAWSPSGTELAFTSEATETSNGPLHVLQPGSDQQYVLTHPPKGVYDFYPAYSPDGEWLAFCRLSTNSTSDIYIVPAVGGAEKRITQENHDLRGIAWMDRRTLLVSSNRAGAQQLWRVDTRTGAVSTFPSAGTNARDPSVSPDGRYVVHSDYTLRSEIWEVPLRGGQAHSIAPSTRQDHSAQYSPDGKTIGFVSYRSGSRELWTMHADGSDPRQLTHFDGALIGSPRWSHDGKYLAFDARPRGHSSVFVIPAAGGTPHPVDDDPNEEKMPSWSHNSKWIYFNSSRGGSQQLWKIPALGGRAVLLAKEYAMDSMESPDGSTVYFLGSGPGVWKVAADGGVAETVTELKESGFDLWHRMVTLTADGIWFLGQGEGFYRVWLYDFRTKQVRPKGRLEPDAILGVSALSVSADGRSLLYARRMESRSDLVLLRRP
jgi:Tol biopolymer transport system component